MYVGRPTYMWGRSGVLGRDRSADDFGILLDGVTELNAGGWWINEPVEGDDDGEEEHGVDDDDEDDDVVRWVISVPLTSDELDIVQERLIAGDSPEDALFAATGSRTFPDDEE